MKLKVNKLDNPRQTLIYMIYLIAKVMRNKRAMPYSELYSETRAKVNGAEFLFIPALDVLFLCGKIAYDPKLDMFEFLEK